MVLPDKTIRTDARQHGHAERHRVNPAEGRMQLVDPRQHIEQMIGRQAEHEAQAEQGQDQKCNDDSCRGAAHCAFRPHMLNDCVSRQRQRQNPQVKRAFDIILDAPIGIVNRVSQGIDRHRDALAAEPVEQLCWLGLP